METEKGDATAWAEMATSFEVLVVGASALEACGEDDVEKKANAMVCRGAVAPAVAAAEAGQEDTGTEPAGAVGKLVADIAVAGTLVAGIAAFAEVETGIGAADTEVVPVVEEEGKLGRRSRA